MEDIKTKILDTVKNGDKYLLYFASIFLFILFAIVIPLKHPGDKSVNEAITSVNTQITYLTGQSANIAKQKDATYAEDQLIKLDEKLVEIEAKKTTLLKERISFIQMADKSVNLPILNVSISQSTVVATFMGFILIGLSLALHYRNKFFFNFYLLPEEDRKNISIPFWCAPIPLTTKNMELQGWILKNSLGILLQTIIIYVGLDSISASKKVDAETNALNIIIYAAAIAIYLITITQLVKQEWKRTTK